jgi:hypothetical protein
MNPLPNLAAAASVADAGGKQIFAKSKATFCTVSGYTASQTEARMPFGPRNADDICSIKTENPTNVLCLYTTICR